MVHDPTVAHFRKGGDELWYASPLHVEDEQSPGFLLLRKIFQRFPVAGVVVEGSPYSLGEFSGEHLRSATQRNDKGLYENGERGYAIKLAAERGIPVIGGEPSDLESGAELINQGYQPRDILGLGFICYIPQWNRLGALDEIDIERLFEREMPQIRRAHRLESADPFDYQDFLRWYEEQNNEPFDPTCDDFEALTPLEKGHMGTQRLSHAINTIRNRTIAHVINERLKLQNRLLVVFGNGHLACHWRALQVAFGEPIYLGDLGDR